MRKSKLNKRTRISSPFDATTHKTEWTCAAKLAEWMNNITQEKDIPLGNAEVETTQEGTRKRVDIILLESPSSEKTLCVIETKAPYFDPFDETELKEPARKKAIKRKAKYFATSNFKRLIWWNTQRASDPTLSEEQQIHDKYNLSEIENLDFIEEPRYKNPILSSLEKFLITLYEVHTGKKPEPLQVVDEWLVWRLQEKIKILALYYKRIIEDKAHKESTFLKQLKSWFAEQNWSFAWQETDFDKAARQAAYLLVNKILFYDVLQAKRPEKLDPLTIPEDLTKGGLLQRILQGYFDHVLEEIDYETIYSTDFLDQTAFPDSKEVVAEIKALVKILKNYDFSTLGYDVVGRIFERLIPKEERHNLGQYFTNADVVDTILSFCLRHEEDKVLDPACGSGTFLVRAYQHKKLMNQRLSHTQILESLWGTDIAKFPAHLATINLAINDLGVDKNYPNILQEDFFSLLTLEDGFELPERWRKVRAKTLNKEERKIQYPRWFDCVIGNPPYTRQEEISKIAPKNAKYKLSLIQKALLDLKQKKLAEISKRAGIHAYFFVHGTKFLKNGGRFGFIVSNSWLDVDYGKGLQEFFLKNYKIIAIIESKVERWFEEADVNTCIVILEKCAGEQNKKERDENLVRFVYLFKPLRHFIPPAQDMWEKEKERLNKIDELKKTILFHDEFYWNDELRIFPKKQKELWEEGLEGVEEGFKLPEKGIGGLKPPPTKEPKYVGSKWGKYLRAPEIFFKILEKGKLVPLNKVARVIGGIITGNNAFFYFGPKKKEKIEAKYLHPIIKSPRELKKISFSTQDLKYKILLCDDPKGKLKNSKILEYIEKGERKNIHKGETFKNRLIWYSLPERKAKLLWVDLRWEKHLCHFNKDNVLFEHLFYGIQPLHKVNPYALCAILNSSITWLLVEILGRTGLGQGAIRLVGKDLIKFPTLNITSLQDEIKTKLENALLSIASRKIEPVFSELGAFSSSDISLSKIKPDRRELDKIIMGEILGLTDEEQLEVYRAAVDLVMSRIEKAKSFGKRKKTKEGIDIELLVKTVMEKIGEETLGKFYKEKILTQKPLYVKTLPKSTGEIRIEHGLFGIRLYCGKNHIDCISEEEARYLKVWLESGLEKVKVPKDETYLKKILPELENLKIKIEQIVENYLSSILDPKTRRQIEHQLWQEITSSISK